MRESYPKARDYYEKAIAISPDLAAGYYSLATICFQLNDKERGFNYLKKGLELDPNIWKSMPARSAACDERLSLS